MRSLHLGYNSIGPTGATSLAKWPVLAHLWQLGLHDNLIGDEGLIALAKSPYLGRLLELDFEQDCWNSRAFTFNDKAAKAFAKSSSLPRLDSLFSGCVDEYHGAAYSTGFTKAGLDLVRKSKWMRPACKAACSDFSGVSDYFESGEFNEQTELGDQDFRHHPPTLNTKEAEGNKHSMQQLRSPGGDAKAVKEERPPKILEALPELDFSDADVVEGLEYRDPTPKTDNSLTLYLSLQDRQRPLPNQVGKFLSDTLGSIFRACSIGYFEASSGASYDEKGRRIDTDVGFTAGIRGDPAQALRLIRETLWRVRAPGNTKLDKLSLNLQKKPSTPASFFLQLAALKITRWQVSGESGHRIDRVPFTKRQRRAIMAILKELKAAKSETGWADITVSDGGHAKVYVKYLKDSADFHALNIFVEALTTQISCVIHRFMLECGLMLEHRAGQMSIFEARSIRPNRKVNTPPGRTERTIEVVDNRR